ncbi:MAG: SpoIIE family protein phosphatase [Coriobacteriales bacterium]|nr:SpoIIE family protein phosphatase [Coriobacteriales bacterium]
MKAKKQQTSVFRWKGLLDTLGRRQRLMVFALQFSFALCLTFTQLGFARLPIPGLNSYVVMLLVPMALAAMLLGVASGMGMSLLSGLLLFIHAKVQPLDYFEVAYITLLSGCGLFLITGLVLSIGFALALRNKPRGWHKVLRIALVCLTASMVFTSAFFIVTMARVISDAIIANPVDSEVPIPASEPVYWANRVFTIGDLGPQFRIDALVMFVFSLVSDFLVAHYPSEADDRPLHLTFNTWLLMVVFLGFMLTTATGYVIITEREKDLEQRDLEEEIDYLDDQRRAQEQRRVVYGLAILNSEGIDDTTKEKIDYVFGIESLLHGYSKDLDGIVIIAHGKDENALILASDDPLIPVGTKLCDTVDRDMVSSIFESLRTNDLRSTVFEHLDKGNETSPNTVRLGYLLAQSQKDDLSDTDESYIYAIMRPASMVFKDRDEVVRWMVVATFVLMAIVYLTVSHLLENVVLNPMNRVGEQLNAITCGKLDTVVDAAGSTEFVGLSTGLNSTVGALKELIAEAERRNEQELMTAKAIQKAALPSLFPPFPDINDFDIYASMDPAREVGGDFYDFFLLEDGVLGFLIADVSGKGIPGALFMMAAKSELDNFMHSGMDLAEAVRRANVRLCEGNDENMFVTVWAATIDYRRGIVTYVNAGHNPPLLRHDGAWTWLDKKSGLFLGAFETAKFRSFTFEMAPGDELLLYTDGVNEAFSVAGEQYGNDRLEAFLHDNTDLGPERLVDELRKSVAAWARGAEQSDDITIMAIEYHPDAEGDGIEGVDDATV